MERLTLKFGDGLYEALDPVDICDNDYSKQNYNEIVKRLGEYEDAEEQGKLLKIPSDIVWFICGAGAEHAMAMPTLTWSLKAIEIEGIDKRGRYWSTKEKAEEELKKRLKCKNKEII